MIQSVNDALAAIHRQTRALPPQSVPLSQAHGLILAQPISMDIDCPPFDRSLLDGFACRAADVHPGARLHIIATHHAGSAPSPDAKPLEPNQCVAINTGAILPQGADSVLMIEHTRPIAPDHIESTHSLTPSTGIQRRGADASANQLVLPPNTRLLAPHLAIAAAAGITSLLAYPRPKIAILTTGDELVDPSQFPGPTQIRNSNLPLLLALAAESLSPNAPQILNLGSAPDNESLLREKIQHALESADLLLISGGMSMGTRDLIPPLLKSLGITFHIEKVRMKPGKPFLFGTLSPPSPTARANGLSTSQSLPTKYIAGLPGNPLSAFVTFHLFVKKIIHLLSGGGDTTNTPLTQALLTTPLPPNGDREFYQPATLSQQNALTYATPLPWSGSANIFSLATANALIQRPPNAPALPANHLVPILHI